MIKNNKKKIIIAAVVVAVVIIAFIICIFAMKKTKKNVDYTINLNQKITENKNIDISIDNLAYADNNLIIEYTVKAKNEDFFLDDMSSKNQFLFYIDRTIKIDGKKIETNMDYSDQLSYKVSEKEAKVYDVIKVANLPDKFNLEVSVFENDYTIKDYFENDKDEDYDEENEYDSDDDTEEYEEYEEDDEEILEKSEAVDTEILEDGEVLEEEIETTEEESYSEVEGYYNGQEENEEDILPEDGVVIGTISTNATKEELSKNVTVETKEVNYKEENVSVNTVKIIKTPFKTFIIANTTITDVSYEIADSLELGDPTTFNIDVQDKNGTSINSIYAQETKITNKKGTDMYDLDIKNEEEITDLVATIRTVILVNEETNGIRLQPYFYEYEFENYDAAKVMETKQWNKVADGEYEGTNELGGKIKITKVEIKDDKILFHYTKEGCVPNTEALLLIRNTNKNHNIFYPDANQYKGMDSEENVIGFNRTNNQSYAEVIDDYDDIELEDIENLEFSIFEGLRAKKLGNGFEL